MNADLDSSIGNFNEDADKRSDISNISDAAATACGSDIANLSSLDSQVDERDHSYETGLKNFLHKLAPNLGRISPPPLPPVQEEDIDDDEQTHILSSDHVYETQAQTVSNLYEDLFNPLDLSSIDVEEHAQSGISPAQVSQPKTMFHDF